MTIEEKDFKLVPINDSSNKFDLYLLHTVKPKGGEPREEFKDPLYGLPLESAIDRIAHYRVVKKDPDGAKTMRQYLDEVKQMRKELLEHVRGTN
jgi:hypothetical protein|nr:MAG TPA: hypothetical protein [Caudoviricetes sp.]